VNFLFNCFFEFELPWERRRRSLRARVWIGLKMEKYGGGNRVLMLAVCVAAIYAAYITQGVVQENV